jgi:hypothetical protein
MEDYNKIIESLGVRYLKSRNMKIAKPVTIKNHYDIENTIFIVNNGFSEMIKKKCLKEICYLSLEVNQQLFHMAL